MDVACSTLLHSSTMWLKFATILASLLWEQKKSFWWTKDVFCCQGPVKAPRCCTKEQTQPCTMLHPSYGVSASADFRLFPWNWQHHLTTKRSECSGNTSRKDLASLGPFRCTWTLQSFSASNTRVATWRTPCLCRPICSAQHVTMMTLSSGHL